MSSAQQQSESEVVELGGTGVVGAEHQHAFSWGRTGGVGDAGVERGGAELIVCTPSRSSNAAGEVRASMYPFDPRKRGSLAPIRRDDAPGTVGGVMEENEGEHRDNSNSNSSCCSYSRKRLDGFGVAHQLSRLIRGKREHSLVV